MDGENFWMEMDNGSHFYICSFWNIIIKKSRSNKGETLLSSFW